MKSITDLIKTHLELLKLTDIERILDEVLIQAAAENWTIQRVLHHLFEIQSNAFIERRVELRIKQSKLPCRKLLSDFDFSFQTGIKRSQIHELATLAFLEKNRGLILAGKSGTGKSHIAMALMLIACQKGMTCRYTTASHLLRDLMSGLADDSVDKKLRVYARPQVLLIDEVGFDRLEQESTRNANLFFKVIEARYDKLSTWMTTNIDFKAFGDYLGDPVITTAIVDRMVHHSIIINIDGPSWRMYQSKILNQSKSKK